MVESETDLSELMDAFDLQEICDTGYGCLLSKISTSHPTVVLPWSQIPLWLLYGVMIWIVPVRSVI